MHRKYRSLLIVGLFSVILLSGLVSLGATPQVACGVDPSKLPDIEGIHLAMPVEQASRVMKSLFPTGTHTLSITAGRFMNAPDKPWLTSMTGVPIASPCNGCTDEVILRFNGPPNPLQVVSVERDLILAGGQQPTLETTIAGLRKKYGPETQKSDDGPIHALSWLFDENGQHLPASTPQFAPGCAGSSLSHSRAASASIILMATASSSRPVPSRHK
jgi:hypothetical protein